MKIAQVHRDDQVQIKVFVMNKHESVMSPLFCLKMALTRSDIIATLSRTVHENTVLDSFSLTLQEQIFLAINHSSSKSSPVDYYNEVEAKKIWV